MKYKNKQLTTENINFQSLAKKFGTPAYCYSYSKLEENINNFKENFKSFSPLICFSVKSNTNLNIIKEIKKFGLGADVVSKGELMLALKAGVNPNKIVFSGVGKTSEEISFAIEKKILLINAESKSEIQEINKIAKRKKKIVQVGIRLNPNTDAKTLKQISTGKETDKFGVGEKEFLQLVKYSKISKFIKLKCISVHIGSQILSPKPYAKMLKVVKKLINKSEHEFEFVDLGGGMGIPYEKNSKKFNFRTYNSLISKFLRENNCKIIFEPGRCIIGNAGILISKIIYIKKNKNKNFVILDAGMNDLMRPALYGAKHQIIPAKKNNSKSNKKIEFVGPICESTDSFLITKKFQTLREGDNIVICDVGAYGMTLSSNYNLRPQPAEILIKNSKVQVIRKKQKIVNLI